jgi:primase-polymerase (primpol)-like protein
MTLGPLAPLAAYRQFIAVLLVPKPNGKTDKLPVRWNTGEVCDAHDPTAWCGYDEAAAAAARGGELFTVGFVLTAADPFFCVDVDGAAQADGTWSPLAQQLCAALPGAVIEVSQSGKGLHLWGRRSPMPEHAKKNVALGIELYSSLRFIALGHSRVGEMAADCPAIDSVIAGYFAPKTASENAPETGPRACLLYTSDAADDM